MNRRFSSIESVLSAVIIPISAAALAIYWPAIQSWYRRRVFQRLIMHELRELTPYPNNVQSEFRWHDHISQECIHQKIFIDPPRNRDFVLSLDPNLIFLMSQLWHEVQSRHPDARQWLYYLDEICLWFGDERREIKKVAESWHELIESYQRQ